MRESLIRLFMVSLAVFIGSSAIAAANQADLETVTFVVA